MNNLPETIYSLNSSGWPPVIDYTLDIDIGCETSYKSSCGIAVNPNDLGVNLLGNNRIKTKNGGTASEPSALIYHLEVTCTASNGLSSSATLTLAIVDTFPTTTPTTTSTPTTTPTTSSTTTTTPTTTSTTTTTPTTTSTTTTTPTTTTTTTPTTTITTTTTPTTTSTTTSTPTTTTTTTPTTTITTTTTPTTSSTTTTTPTITTTPTTTITTTTSSEPLTQSLDADDGVGFFESAAGIATLVGGVIAAVGLLAGAGAALWKLLGARRKFRRKEGKQGAQRNNGRYGDKQPRRRLRNIRPKEPPNRNLNSVEISEQMNKKFKPPSSERTAPVSRRGSLYNFLEPPSSPRTSHFHVYYQDASYIIVKPQITPVENNGRIYGF